MSVMTMNLFEATVDSLDDPQVKEFMNLLQNCAQAYDCKMRSFAIHKGVAFFSFDNDEIMQDLAADMQEITGVRADICKNEDEFIRKAKKTLKRV
ncbi:MAG: hypothetical protein WCI20_00220 [bacterium]